jgi:hypothetical protein
MAFLDTLYSAASPGLMTGFNKRFLLGDQFSAECRLDNRYAERSNCAFYFFIRVPIVNGQPEPFAIDSTISQSQANRFCYGAGYESNYLFNHSYFEDNRDNCFDTLWPN